MSELTRRKLLAGILAALTTQQVGTFGEAHQPSRLGYLHDAPLSFTLPQFARALADVGYIQGNNIIIESRWTREAPNGIVGLARELVDLKADVIVAEGNRAVRAAQLATRRIPIVMAPANFPLEHGFISALARPGGNITGIMFASDREVQGKIGVFAEIVPNARILGFLADADTDQAERVAVERAALRFGMRVVTAAVRRGELETVFLGLKRDSVDGLFVSRCSFAVGVRRLLVDLAAKHHIPAIWEPGLLGDDGALVTYGARLPDLYSRVAYFVDRLIKGARPAELPVTEPTRFELVINIAAANALQISVPTSVIARADRTIQ